MSANTATVIEADGSASNAHEYTVTFQVVTTDKNDGPLTALTAPGIPDRGTWYAFGNEVDYWSFADQARAKLQSVENSRKLWRVTVTYRHPNDSQQQNDTPNGYYGDPLDIGWKISGSFANAEKPVSFDSEGDPIQNSVEEFFLDPPLMADDGVDTLILERNTPTISLKDRATIRGTVNETPIWGLEPRQAKLVRWDYRVLYYGNKQPYIANTWEFQIKSTISKALLTKGNEIGWTDEIIDKGSRYLLNANALDPRVRFANITDRNMRFLLAFLDGNGNILPENAPKVYLQFKVERETDFTSYGFPAVLPGPFV